ncbi:MAG: DUF1015 domain-containing protein [Treponema sp.]|jgi:uncharacterized protein (DUF1015 family)|nr:DUF1015 domain-containing protein [Treponema sp.]
MNTIARFGLKAPEILLPRAGIDLEAWAVIACDQYTQDRAYWEQAATARQGKPSTLSLILPEVYLEDDGTNGAIPAAARIEHIHRAMKRCLAEGVFAAPFTGMVYVERETAYGRCRAGLVAAIDLEAYDWKPGSAALIRATEATVPARLPPRMNIRRGAPLELPHIMLLVNDPKKHLVEAAGREAKTRSPLYDTPLMPDAGRVTGWQVRGDAAFNALAGALADIERENTAANGDVFLFAVGDGNHSLASAKAIWEEYKPHLPAAERGQHPARYALAEIVNIYDEGLTFEPIHRVVFNAERHSLAKALENAVNITQDGPALRVSAKNAELAVSSFQPALDAYLSSHPECAADYIHGEDEVLRLVQKPGTVGFILPPIAKESFFSTIAVKGTLPRKSFSMGEASEKRFYLECRTLF